MKMVLKVLGGFVASVLLAIGGFVLFIQLGWPVRMPTRTIDVKIEATPERLARGKKLVSLRCATCHYDQKTNALTGTFLAADPKEFGTAYSHNITTHSTKGTGRYTDGELVTLLRTGIRRDGVYPGPYMMSPNLADEDLYSIIAFLRSDDPWVQPRDVDDQVAEPTFLFKFLVTMVIKSPPFPKAAIPVPSPEDKVALGKYVITAVADCFVCHSASFPTLDSNDPEKSGGYMGGGNELLDARGVVVRGPNLTMDPETGIGKWSEADFISTVRTGFLPDKRPLRYPMLAHTELTEHEVSAVFAYLKTVPVIRNPVQRDMPAAPATKTASASASGEELYKLYQCTSCHGDAGLGVCDLREASKKYDTDEKLAAFIHDPSQFVPGTKMPTWNGVLEEREYAPLIEYVHELEKRR